MIILECRDFCIRLDPGIGGSISSAKWRGLDILRPQQGGSVLGSGCFPLVPFSNRIANSRFDFGGRRIELAPNHPDDPACAVLHGFGWLAAWRLAETTATSAQIAFDCPGDEWPWAFEALQTVAVREDGFDIALSIENRGAQPMPAGLGFHPYFPRGPKTTYHGLHRGEWLNTKHCIPESLKERAVAADWWNGQPVASRQVDTVYTERDGPLTVRWPERGIGAIIEPSADLEFTTVYVPENEDWFCVEPVSHMTDAFNRDRHDSGTRVLAPGESWTVEMALTVFEL